MTVTLLTAVDHRHEADLVAAIEGGKDIVVARRCADVAELASVAAAGVGEVAIVSVTFRGVDRDLVRSLAGHGVRTVGMCERADESGERVLRQLGVHAVVHPDTPAPDLVAAVLAAGGPSDHLAAAQARTGASHGAMGSSWPVGASSAGQDRPSIEGSAPTVAGGGTADGSVEGEPAPTERSGGRVVAIWGPTGAPGRTTVAVTLAALASGHGTSVLLVDADTWGASVGQFLALLDEAPGLAAAARLSEQGVLDVAALARLAPEVSSGLRVLTGLPRADRWPEVREGAMRDILAMSRMLADLVVVDCGFAIEDDEELSYDTVAPRRNVTTTVTLAEAEEVVVVGGADPVGLQRLVRAVQDVQELAGAAPRVVVNKVRRSASGPDPERAIADVLGRFSGLSEATFVPWASAECDRALWEGRALPDVTPDAPVVAAFRAVLDSVVPATEGRAVRRGHRRARD